MKRRLRRPEAIPPSIFEGDARSAAIGRIVNALLHWKASPFELEAETLVSVRSALCSHGYGWARSDFEARALVTESLALLGAQRPSWEEGQREHAVAREDCRWCAMPVPPELTLGKFEHCFCSAKCARNTLRFQSFSERSYSDALYEAAHRTLQRLRNPIQNCRQCKRPFHPIFAHHVFCSQTCHGAHSVIHQPRECPQCSEVFKPSGGHTKFCSTRCRDAARRTRPMLICEVCESPFTSKNHTTPGKGRFCSRACDIEHRKAQKFACTCIFCGSAFFGSTSKTSYCSNNCVAAMYRLRKRGGGTTGAAFLTREIFDREFGVAA